jgi:hypothetical protein
MAILAAIRTQPRHDCPSAHPCSARMAVRIHPDGPGQSGRGPNISDVGPSHKRSTTAFKPVEVDSRLRSEKVKRVCLSGTT